MARRGRCAPARSTAKSPTAFAANGAPPSTPISDPSSKPHGEDRSEPSTPSASPSRAAPCLAQLENVNGDLSNYVYAKMRSPPKGKGVDKTYADNESFWTDALSPKHRPGTRIILEDFHLTEWLPFAPGRYFTWDAGEQRKLAAKHVAFFRGEYTPKGKGSMVRGGIGAFRLAEKRIEEGLFYFLGASSNGIAHQGIPIAMPQDEYDQVMPAIIDHGGCRARLVGRLRTVTEDLPQLYFGPSVPRYCFFAEEAKFKRPSRRRAAGGIGRRPGAQAVLRHHPAPGGARVREDRAPRHPGRPAQVPRAARRPQEGDQGIDRQADEPAAEPDSDQIHGPHRRAAGRGQESDAAIDRQGVLLLARRAQPQATADHPGE